MNDTKHWLKSRTILFNLLIVLATVIAEQSDFIKTLLSPQHYGTLMLVVALINTYLRLGTSTAITPISPEKPKD